MLLRFPSHSRPPGVMSKEGILSERGPPGPAGLHRHRSRTGPSNFCHEGSLRTTTAFSPCAPPLSPSSSFGCSAQLPIWKTRPSKRHVPPSSARLWSETSRNVLEG